MALDTSEDGVLSVSELHGRHDLDLDGNGELSAEEAASLLGEGVNLEWSVLLLSGVMTWIGNDTGVNLERSVGSGHETSQL